MQHRILDASEHIAADIQSSGAMPHSYQRRGVAGLLVLRVQQAYRPPRGTRERSSTARSSFRPSWVVQRVDSVEAAAKSFWTTKTVEALVLEPRLLSGASSGKFPADDESGIRITLPLPGACTNSRSDHKRYGRSRQAQWHHEGTDDAGSPPFRSRSRSSGALKSHANSSLGICAESRADTP